MIEVFDLRGKKVCLLDEARGRIEMVYRRQFTIVYLSPGNDMTIKHDGAVTRIIRQTDGSFRVERSMQEEPLKKVR